MEKNKLKSNKVLISTLIVVLLIGFGYFYFSGSDNAEVISLDSGTGEPLGQDILALADKLNTLSINTSVFSSTLFTSLLDLGVPLQPEIQGRANPFAKIGSETAVVATPKR